MTRFCSFCHSPYFVKHEQVRRLVRYLSDIYPQFDAKHCDEQLLYQLLFGEGDLDKGKIALVFTYTQRAFEDFIAQEQYQKDKPEQKYRLLQAYRAMSQFTTFEKALKRLESEHAKVSQKDASHYYYAYRLAKSADDYYNHQDRRRVDNSLQQKQKSLDHFFILEKLRDACEVKVRQRILKVEYPTRFLKEVLAEIANDEPLFSEVPAILVYFKIYQMLDHGEQSEHYQEAFVFFSEHTYLFEKEELTWIYIYFMNYCIARINRGDNAFLKEIFQIYKAQLAQNLLLENGELSEWDYKNIVTTALRLRELDWVFQFIQDYRDQLNEQSRENAYRFNLANYYYAKGNFDKVLDLLIQVEYSDLRYNLSAKALLLRTYFDLGEYEALHSLTESFKQYLLRNKLMSDARRVGYNNLFKLTRKIANYKAKQNFMNTERQSREITKLQKELRETPLMYNREWLEEKLLELPA